MDTEYRTMQHIHPKVVILCLRPAFETWQTSVFRANKRTYPTFNHNHCLPLHHRFYSQDPGIFGDQKVQTPVAPSQLRACRDLLTGGAPLPPSPRTQTLLQPPKASTSGRRGDRPRLGPAGQAPWVPARPADRLPRAGAQARGRGPSKTLDAPWRGVRGPRTTRPGPAPTRQERPPPRPEGH